MRNRIEIINSQLLLVRLDLGIKIEPLLLSCPATAAPPLFYLRLELEIPNFVRTLGGSTELHNCCQQSSMLTCTSQYVKCTQLICLN